MRRNISLAIWTLIVVLIIHGPQVSDLLVRSTASLVPEGSMPGSEASIQKLDGVLAIHEARHCPPAWLKIGGKVVDRTVITAPVRAEAEPGSEQPGKVLAWVIIPESVRSIWVLYAQQKHSVVVANPVIRTDLLGFYPEDEMDRSRIHRQLLQCPLPSQDVYGYNLQEVPPYMGTLVTAQVSGNTALGSDSFGLLFQIGIRWLVIFWIIFFYRRFTERDLDPEPQAITVTRLDGVAPAQTMFRVMRMGLIWRIFLSLVISAALLWAFRGGSHVWDRASGKTSLEDPVQNDEMHYSAILGSANVHDAFVCPIKGHSSEVSAGLRKSRLMIRVHRESAGAIAPLLLSLPYSPEDPVVRTLLRKGSEPIPFHVYGYRSLMAEPLLLWKKEDGCTPLAGGDPQMVGLQLRMVHEADPWAPRVYRAELLGLGILAILIGGTFGYFWSLRTFRRRRKEAIETELSQS